jgi:ABC-type sugar transport system permease subunit
MSKQYFSVLPLLILLGLIMMTPGANSARLGAKEMKDADFDNNLSPGQMILQCRFGGSSVWSFNGQVIQGNQQYEQMFNINGGTLMNRQQTSGDYNGKYMCLDLTGNAAGTEYSVRINGTSNLSTGAIVGIVFAVIFAVIIIVVGLYLAHKNGYLGGDSEEYDENDKLQGHDVEVDDYDRNSHAGRFRNTGQTSMLN